jgi:hypothetical protein
MQVPTVPFCGGVLMAAQGLPRTQCDEDSTNKFIRTLTDATLRALQRAAATHVRIALDHINGFSVTRIRVVTGDAAIAAERALRRAAAAAQAPVFDVASERRTRRLGCRPTTAAHQTSELDPEDCCVRLTYADLVAQKHAVGADIVLRFGKEARFAYDRAVAEMRRRLQTGPPACRVGDVIGVVALARTGLGCASARHTETK